MPHEVRVSRSPLARLPAAGTPLWIDAGLEVCLQGPDGERRIAVDKPYARLGTHPAAEVRFRTAALAVRDVYLHATQHGVFCCSVTSIAHSGEPCHGWLPPEQWFVLGPYRAKVRRTGTLPPDGGLPMGLDEKDPAPRHLPVVAVSFDGRRATRRALSRRLTVVGRRWPSTLRIGSPALSTCHVALYWDDQELWAIDLLSRVGTWIDGEAFDVARVPIGTHLRIGEVEIEYLGATTSRAADSEESSLDHTPPSAAVAPWTEEEGNGAGSSTNLASSIGLVASAEPVASTDSERTPAEPLRGLLVGLGPQAPALPPTGDLLADVESMRSALKTQQDQWLARREETERQLSERHVAIDEAHHQTFEEAVRQAAELDRDRDAIQALQTQIEQQSAILEAERKAFSQVRRKRSRELSQLKQQQQQAAVERAAMETDRVALAEKHAALEAERATLETDRGALAEQHAAMEAEHATLEAGRTTLETDRVALAEQHAAMEAERATLEAGRTTLETDRVALAEQHAAMEAERATLETDRGRLVELEGTLARRQAEFEASRTIAMDSEAQRREALSVVEAQLAGAEAWLVAEREALATGRGEVDAAVGRLQQTQSDSAAREKVLADQQRSLDAREQMLSQQRASLELEQSECGRERAAWEVLRDQWQERTRERDDALQARERELQLGQCELATRERDLQDRFHELQAREREVQPRDAVIEASEHQLPVPGQDLPVRRAEAMPGSIAGSSRPPAAKPASHETFEPYDQLSHRLFSATRARTGWWSRLKRLLGGGT